MYHSLIPLIPTLQLSPGGQVHMSMADEAVTPAYQSAELLGMADDAVLLRRELTRLSALDKVKSDFLDLVSHELRGPLSVARGYVSMLADGSLGELDANAAVVLPVVLSKLDDMSRMIDQMLLTARLEDSRLHLDRKPTDIRRLVGDAVASVQQRAHSAGHAIVVEDAAEELSCRVDASRIVTVLLNLLDNAVKYSAAGSEVDCTVRREGDTCSIAVADHGEGISAEDRRRLFTRFGRATSAANRGIPGTGLGLYISRELARRHDGDITVSSKKGVGSTFTLTLPLSEA